MRDSKRLRELDGQPRSLGGEYERCHKGGGRFLHVRQRIRVRVERERDAGMAEPLRDDLRMHAGEVDGVLALSLVVWPSLELEAAWRMDGPRGHG